ncbi:MAG TPA: primosome assembly protein PriA, partial [Mycobacteriales bacterium]|nr:primosome assembly protein PriA [Mycobacteriales bacterium]
MGGVGAAAGLGRRPGTRKPSVRPALSPAADLPVARVAVDVSLAHLDRSFDYLVPESMAASAVVGARVRVRFAGRLVEGFVLDRGAASEHGGRFAFLHRVTSAEPVLSAEVAALARAVADRWAGTLADVLRLAVPPRHAATEARPAAAIEARVPAGPSAAPARPEPGSWARYRSGPAFLEAVATGGAPRAVWTALPGPCWPEEIARVVQAALSGGRGALVVVPDARDVARVDAALTAALGPGRHVALTAGLGPAERYARFLQVSRGIVRAVVGTRSAVFAPVHQLGLIAIWDDGDDLHAEPHAPYPHARDVLVLRAHRLGAAALIGGVAVTSDAAVLLERGWARPLAAPRASVRALAPRVVASGADEELARDSAARSARLPRLAFDVVREGLAEGPVLVQVPRAGFEPALACAGCRAPARCGRCAGPLARLAARAFGGAGPAGPGVGPGGGDPVPACRWCGRPAVDRRCPACGHRGLRALVVGAARTADELARAFPGVPVRRSGAPAVLASVPDRPALVVATPGAEPLVATGYTAAALLDAASLLGRADLRAAEEALRRWLNAASLVRPGGRVLVTAEPGLPPVQALLRWDPAGFADRELAERTALGLPPAMRVATVDGPPAA